MTDAATGAPAAPAVAPRGRNRRRIAVLFLLLLAAVAAFVATAPARRAMMEKAWVDRLDVIWARQEQEAALEQRRLRAELRDRLRRLAQEPEDFQALMEAAARYGQLRFYPRALFLLGEAERLRPEDPAVWRAKGEVYLATGEYDRCIEVLERGLELKPDDLELRLMRVDIDAILGWSMDSRVRIRELLELYPNEPRVHLMAALLSRQIADARGAQEHLRTALRLDPRNDRVYGLLSGLEWEVGQRKEALEHIQQALELNSHSLDYLLHLAEIQRSGAVPGAPEWKEAEKTYRRALMVSPASVQARFGVALCRLRQGREDALELLEQIVRQHPFSPAPLLELGNLYNRMGRREEGAKLLARYNEGIRENDELKGLSLRMAMQAENPASYIDMGAMFVRTGQPQKAVVVLRRALRMKPSSTRARELLVRALRLAGRDPEIPGILARP